VVEEAEQVQSKMWRGGREGRKGEGMVEMKTGVRTDWSGEEKTPKGGREEGEGGVGGRKAGGRRKEKD